VPFSFYENRQEYKLLVNTPETKPIKSGTYEVAAFAVNNDTVPPLITDSMRWQNVVFEKWNSISIRSNRPVIPERSNTEEIYLKDEDKTFSSIGSIGRHFYRYQVDTVSRVLYLQHRNKNYAEEKLVLHYERPNPRQIILSGLNEQKDSIRVVLDKINKIYLLDESFKMIERGEITDSMTVAALQKVKLMQLEGKL